MKRLPAILKSVCCFLVISLFGGCGNNKNDAKKTENKIANKPATDTVEITQMQFKPAQLTIQRGDTVVFVNKDIVAHDVTEASKKAWASGPLSTGAFWKTAPSNDVDYYCSIHVVMKGKIHVADHR
jgi:plastocyanin